MFGSVDVNNICNLHCKHCYWWINRKEEEKDLPAEDWRKQIWIGMIINSLNYTAVKDLAGECMGKINKIGFQFHTPFVKGDPL